MKSAENFEYRVINSNEIEIKGLLDKEVEELSIPAEIDGMPVTSIGGIAFLWCENLIAVSIPDTVTNIGNAAFSCCKNLPEIRLPDGIVNIGKHAFNGCDKLALVNIPASVTTIGDGAFAGCKTLEDIEVAADNTAYISKAGALFSKDITLLNSFLAGKEIASYDIPANVTNIGEKAFRGCALSAVSFPDGLTTIADGAFSWCKKLTSISIPDSVMNIGKKAFFQCKNLSTVSLPDEVKIGEDAFKGCPWQPPIDQ